MNTFLKIFITLFIGLNGWVMCRGWIGIFSQNLPFVNALTNLFQQNREMVIWVILLLSFLCTVISLVAFSWAIKKLASLKLRMQSIDERKMK